MSARRAVGTIITAFTGCLVGGAVCLGAARAGPPAGAPRTPPPQLPEESSNARARVALPPPDTSARAAALPPPSAASAATAAPTASAPVVPYTREEAERFEATYREKTLRDHAEEPRDPSWATKAEQSFRSDLMRLATNHHFDVRGVDCRTTTCLATLGWTRYAAAEGDAAKLAETDFSRNCSRTVFVPPPTDLEGPAEGDLVLDCESDRVDGR